jgi:polysaccharide export outer membrane protein
MIVEMMLGMLLGQAPEPPAAVLSPVPRGYEDTAHKAEGGTPMEGGSPASAAVSASTDPGYRIGPEDVLQIDVWKEADFSSSSPVRADGKISVPLLNDVQAAGLTPTQLAASLRDQLSKYVVEPKITVSVTQMNSRKAYVMGEVNRQGIVRLQSNLTVLQAISSAGGLAPFANGKKIYVLRSRGGEQLKLPFNYDAVIKGKHAEQNIVLQPGDTIVVP